MVADSSQLLADDQRTLFAAAVDANTRARAGEPFSIVVDPAAFHFFDRESGESLLAVREPAVAA